MIIRLSPSLLTKFYNLRKIIFYLNIYQMVGFIYFYKCKIYISLQLFKRQKFYLQIRTKKPERCPLYICNMSIIH